jgi:hypothetical protein
VSAKSRIYVHQSTKCGFSKKAFRRQYFFLFKYVLLIRYHHLRPKLGMYIALCIFLNFWQVWYTNIPDITEVKQTNINLPVGYERNVDWFVIVVICAPDEVISVSYWRIWNVWYNGVKTYMKSHWNVSAPGFHQIITYLMKT